MARTRIGLRFGLRGVFALTTLVAIGAELCRRVGNYGVVNNKGPNVLLGEFALLSIALMFVAIWMFFEITEILSHPFCKSRFVGAGVGFLLKGNIALSGFPFLADLDQHGADQS